MWDPKPSELPFGVNRNSTFEMLFQARRAIRELRNQPLPEDEDFRLADQAEELWDLIVRKRGIVGQQKQTRRENKAAARLKRMGGPLRPALKPAKAPKLPPKK